MKRIFDWIKDNKLTVGLLAAVGFLFWRSYFGFPVRPLMEFGATSKVGRVSEGLAEPLAIGDEAGVARSFLPPVPPEQEVPPTESQDRLVIRETSLSMVVEEAAQAMTRIQQKAEELGGFLVSSRLSKPEEAASGTISVRVPEEKLTQALEAFRSVGVRVVDEQVSGRDVTDQYEDLEARLKTLEKTKAKFEEILEKAEEVQELLQVQRELVNLQSQIDRVKGRQKYLEQSAKLSKITVHLSTDEFSLPYAPAEPWRPSVVFKLAVRSLVTNFRKIGSGLIWIVVYSPIWLPILAVVWFINRRKQVSP